MGRSVAAFPGLRRSFVLSWAPSMNRRFSAVFLPFVCMITTLFGCDSDDSASQVNERAFPGTTITVAAIDDSAALTALKAWHATWERETGGKVEFLPEVVDPSDLKSADVILYPADRMGELVDQKKLALLHDTVVRPPVPLGSQVLPPDPLAYGDIATAFREQVSKYGEDRFGLPLGGSGLVLVYRRDAFDSEANKAAAKQAGISLAIPKTWQELDALIRFFHGRDWDGDGAPESGIVAAFGPDKEGVGNAMLLARATSLGQHPDHYALLFNPDTLEPRIATPPFIEALSALAQWKTLAPAKAETFDAEAARAAFRAGETAFLIDRAERASRWTDPKKPLTVSLAPLPASHKVYDPERKTWQEVPTLNRAVYLPRGGGWLIGISRETSGPKRKAALDFVRAVASPETSRQIVRDSALPLLPTRNSQLNGGLPDPGSALGVDSSAWGVAVARTMTAPRIVLGPRIPGTGEYLAILDKARVTAIQGTPAESALIEAAKGWSALSEKLGLERQLWHYRRSLNKLPTNAEPPGRPAAPAKAAP
jgi:multiple sugar transport system substrate-binding protein